MSEKSLKILLSELKNVRIRCKNEQCGMVYEMPLAEMANRNFSNCPVCKLQLTAMIKNERSYDLGDLARAIAFISSTQKNVEIEFVLPDNS